MERVCYNKYAKRTGHVPQLFYDAWHECRIQKDSDFISSKERFNGRLTFRYRYVMVMVMVLNSAYTGPLPRYL